MKERKPRYWQLDSLILAMMAVLYLIMRANLPPLGEQLLEIGAVVLGSALLGLWIYTNAGAIEAEERRKREQLDQSRPPLWWRPGLNERQRHYLAVKHGTRQPSPKEP